MQESWYKVAVYIYYHVFICWKVQIKLGYVYIITCLSAGKLIKVAACLYYHVFICMNVSIKLRSVYTVSLRVHWRESWDKVALCIYYHVFICRKVDIKLQDVCIYLYVFICRKVDIKLRYVYVFLCSSTGKLISSCSFCYHVALAYLVIRNQATCVQSGDALVYVFMWGEARVLPQERDFQELNMIIKID